VRWAWSCYVWLPNTTVAAPALDRTLTLLAMAAMLVAASPFPQAFTSASFLFACVLMAVRVLHVVLFILSTREDPQQRGVLQRLIPSLLAGPALILAAAFVNSPYRELNWLAAVAVDVSGPLVAGVEGFQVMPAYFVERHGSMIIIALGEAIVQIGVGAGADLGRPPVLAGAVLGVLICAALWWTYFGSAHHRRFDGYRRRARRAGSLASGNR
jgi:low temperature requirement protein LtrA